MYICIRMLYIIIGWAYICIYFFFVQGAIYQNCLRVSNASRDRNTKSHYKRSLDHNLHKQHVCRSIKKMYLAHNRYTALHSTCARILV